MEAKIIKISSENFFLCWMLFWTGVDNFLSSALILSLHVPATISLEMDYFRTLT